MLPAVHTPGEVFESRMPSPNPRNLPYRTLTVAALVLAIVGGYVLVWVHAEYVHGSVESPHDCAVCSWAKSLPTFAVADPPVVAGRPAGQIPSPSLPMAPPSSYRLPFSARPPPPTV